MTLRHYDPFEIINRVLSSGNQDGYHSYPVHDVYVNSEDALVFDFALAGFSKDEIGVELSRNVLTVSASKKQQESKEENKWLHRKIATRDFEIKYVMPNSYDSDNATAKYEDGMLKVVVPLAEAVKPKLLTIN